MSENEIVIELKENKNNKTITKKEKKIKTKKDKTKKPKKESGKYKFLFQDKYKDGDLHIIILDRDNFYFNHIEIYFNPHHPDCGSINVATHHTINNLFSKSFHHIHTKRNYSLEVEEHLDREFKKIKNIQVCQKCGRDKDNDNCKRCETHEEFREFKNELVGKFSQERCSICLDNSGIYGKLDCGHFFHLFCISKVKTYGGGDEDDEDGCDSYIECVICKSMSDKFTIDSRFFYPVYKSDNND